MFFVLLRVFQNGFKFELFLQGALVTNPLSVLFQVPAGSLRAPQHYFARLAGAWRTRVRQHPVTEDRVRTPGAV